MSDSDDDVQVGLFNLNKFSFEDTGSSVTIANAPEARLMYYLNSVASVLEINSVREFNYYCDYERYWKLGISEKKVLYDLSTIFSPNILIGKVFFNNEEMNKNNMFLKLSQVNIAIGVVDSIVIGGQRTQVTKIMLFQRSWMQRNYYSAINELRENIFRRQSETCEIL